MLRRVGEGDSGKRGVLVIWRVQAVSPGGGLSRVPPSIPASPSPKAGAFASRARPARLVVCRRRRASHSPMSERVRDDRELPEVELVMLAWELSAPLSRQSPEPHPAASEHAHTLPIPLTLSRTLPKQQQ